MQNILINIVLIRKTVWCPLSSLKSLWTVITVLRYVLGTRDNSAVQILTRVTLDRSALTTPNVFWLQCTRPWTTTTSCWRVPCSSPLWSALAKTAPRRPLLTRLLRTLSALFNALSPPLFRALWYVALCRSMASSLLTRVTILSSCLAVKPKKRPPSTWTLWMSWRPPARGTSLSRTLVLCKTALSRPGRVW